MQQLKVDLAVKVAELERELAEARIKTGQVRANLAWIADNVCRPIYDHPLEREGIAEDARVMLRGQREPDADELAALGKYDAMMWQPIETAPKDGTRILVTNAKGDIDVGSYCEDWVTHTEFVRKAKDGDVYKTVRENIGYWETNYAYCPTHWMPLPPPPEGE
jgi:hypothetical protein